MNFNYGYNVKSQMFNAKQVEKVKEEVVEKKEAEVKAKEEAPKYEVVTGDADKILADINKATVKGASGPEGLRGGDTWTFDRLLNNYNVMIVSHDYCVSTQDLAHNMGSVTYLLQLLSELIAMPEFEEQSEELKTKLANDFVRWTQEANSYAAEYIQDAQNGQIGNGVFQTFFNRYILVCQAACTNGPVYHSYTGNDWESHGGIDVIAQYTDINVADFITNNMNMVLDAIAIEYGKFSEYTNGYFPVEVIQSMYNALSDTMAEQKEGMSNLSSQEQMEIWNSNTERLFDFVNNEGLYIDQNDINVLRGQIFDDYITNNAERDTFVKELSVNIITSNLASSEEILEAVVPFEQVPDTVQEYDTIFNKLDNEQNIAFFTSKVDSHQHVLATIEFYLNNPNLNHEAISVLEGLQIKFEELLAAALDKLGQLGGAAPEPPVNPVAPVNPEPPVNPTLDFDALLEMYNAAKADFKDNINNLSPQQKLEQISNMLKMLGGLISMPECEQQGAAFNTRLANDYLNWNEISNQAVADFMKEAHTDKEFQAVVKYMNTINTAICSNDALGEDYVPSQIGGLNVILQYGTNVDVLQILTDHINTSLNFASVAPEGIGQELDYNVMCTQLMKQLNQKTQGIEFLTPAEQMDVYNEIGNVLNGIISNEGFDSNIPELGKVLSFYINNEQKRNGVIENQASLVQEFVISGAVVGEPDLLENAIGAFEAFGDTTQGYLSMYDVLPPTERLTFFENKVSTISNVLDALRTLQKSGMLNREMSKRVQVLIEQFKVLYEMAVKLQEQAQNEM